MKKIFIIILCFFVAYGCQVKDKDMGCNTNENCEVDITNYDKEKTLSIYNETIKDQQFINIGFNDVVKKVEAKETFVLLYTFKTCPWCQQLLPILLNASKDLKTKVYYVTVRDQDNHDLRNDDNAEYVANYQIVKALVKEKIFVPALFKFVDGKPIAVHFDTVENHDAKKRLMNEEEKALCYKQLIELMEAK